MLGGIGLLTSPSLIVTYARAPNLEEHERRMTQYQAELAAHAERLREWEAECELVRSLGLWLVRSSDVESPKAGVWVGVSWVKSAIRVHTAEDTLGFEVGEFAARAADRATVQLLEDSKVVLELEGNGGVPTSELLRDAGWS